MTTREFRDSGLQLRTSKQAVVDYKVALVEQIKNAGLQGLTAEHQFMTTRKFRYDFAFVEHKVAIDYEGGIFAAEASHSSISGILRDIEKHTEAQLHGWIVIRCTAKTVENGQALRFIKRALEIRGVLA